MIQSTPLSRMVMSEILITTLHLDDHSARHFTALRDRYFPPAINYLPAHVTLFHNLPSSQLQQLSGDVRAFAEGQPAILVNVTGLRFLGRGVAYKLESKALSSLRQCLASRWDSLLQRQDRQPFQPHITIQNKVLPEEARQLYEALVPTFEPWAITGTGIDFWHYHGGPWEHAAFVAF